MADWSKRFEGHLELCPPVTDSQLGQIPAKRGVMLLLAEADRPIILLTAANIRARLKGRLTEPLEEKRRKTVDLRAITRKVLWKLTDWHFETELAYFEAARRIWPKDYQKLLAWHPAWFVRVDPGEEYPHFAKTRDPLRSAGVRLGPFPDGRTAERFIAAIQDAFDLCRDTRCLRSSPNGQRCAYAQMNRCLSPCDGTISMDAYRRVVAEAASFAAGRRDAPAARLRQEMQAAAKTLEFEKASAIKVRLERLEQFDQPCYAQLAPLADFQYLLIQPGRGRREAKAFIASGGRVVLGGRLEYPLKGGQLRRVLARAESLAARPMDVRPQELWRMGLVAHYLFCGEKRRGVIVRRPAAVGVEALAELIEKHRDLLRLRAPAKRKKTSPDEKGSN